VAARQAQSRTVSVPRRRQVELLAGFELPEAIISDCQQILAKAIPRSPCLPRTLCGGVTQKKNCDDRIFLKRADLFSERQTRLTQPIVIDDLQTAKTCWKRVIDERSGFRTRR
jgi:hypothetical protein